MDFYRSKTYIEDLIATSQDVTDIKSLRGSSILITGCTGTIGSWIADTLLLYNEINAADMKIILAGRRIDRMKAHFEKCPTASPVYAHFDLGKAPEWNFPVDYIIHTAGNAHPAAFNGDPCGTITGNIMGTWNLLKYGLDHGCKRFLYISTGEVYGQGDLSLESFEETYGGYVDPTSPRSSYPNSKRAAETLCASFTAQYGMETVIVR
ncbi:MAG: NAD-dependent epimerase/dehydratase family protein, partial [Lachnospiraceae bacterium]|nr:NAD-dependent epimerase/dehydratase family protein [Lachnospiraceae bacterium]